MYSWLFDVETINVGWALSVCVQQPGKQKKKFSSFFKSLVIELDKELYGPDNHLVEVSTTNKQTNKQRYTDGSVYIIWNDWVFLIKLK